MNGRASYALESAADHAAAISLQASDPIVRRVSPLVWVFGGTLFLSAAMLFMVEPTFAKMVLPYLGGSPAVWNTCVVFFQAAMLAGYAYAHLLTRRLPIRGQVLVHLSLALAVSLLLPIAIPAGWAPPVDRSPVPSMLFLLLVAVGGPFFVVSATAPLLQHWFSQTRDRSASDPYFLYSASNLGSVTALLAYPSIVEPTWSLTQQRLAWSGAYAAFGAALLTCAVVALRYRSSEVPRTAATPREETRDAAPDVVTWRRRLRWLALAFVPSSLMLGVTTFVSTDVAAVPLLWVAPLTLYLLSFVVAFSSKPFISQRVAGAAALITIPVLVLSMVAGIALPARVMIPLHLIGFFAYALLLHRQLADDRPDPRTLTTFYLWISLGGLLGGMFNTLVAPVVFTSVAEYPLMLLAVCALRPALPGIAARFTYRDLLIPLMLGALLAAILAGVKEEMIGTALVSIGLGLMGGFYRAAVNTRFRLTAGVALMLGAGLIFGPSAGDVVHAERTFFGVMRVRRDDTGRLNTLLHGNTLHGEQSIDPARRREPLSYYHHAGPIGQVMAAVSDRIATGRIGVVGLGAGSMAAYAQPGQRWTFYEIDPAVERIAGSPQFFTYMTDCGDACRVELGDARLSLARSRDQFDVLILDAFSSDAIPVHLLTREALQIYLDRLSPGGVIAFHISNRHLDLRPILGALAADAGLQAISQLDAREERQRGHLRSNWLVMAREPDALDQLKADSRWTTPAVGTEVWTDDFSNVFKALLAG